MVSRPLPSIEDLFERALSALAAGDLNRAEQLTRELLGQDQDNVEAWSLLANIYQESGHPERALGPATRAVELDPDNIQNWNTLGYRYLLLGRWKEGEQCYARAASMPNAPATVFLNHAWALIELGQDAAAVHQLRRAISLHDEIPDTIRQDPHYKKLLPLLEELK